MHPRELKLVPHIPTALAALSELSANLHWTWDRETRHLFEALDPTLWHSSGGDPLRLLAEITTDRWAELAADPAVVAATAQAAQRLHTAMTGHRWFQTHTSPSTKASLGLVAYFSPEFGISETLPQYAGGLGILAGDHLKATSDLGVPLVAIGLLYDEGYFRQRLNADGMQQESYPPLDPHSLPLHDTGVQVSVDMAGDEVRLHVWRVQVGRVPLYLLDTNVAENSVAAAMITDRLYGGDTEHRLQQEILLGIGGVRALRALGLAPDVFHTNEGHAGFLSLERARELVAATDCTFAEAVERGRAGCLFTTHTPVAAGIDRFTRELMVKYFTSFADACGCSFDELMAVGQDVEKLENELVNSCPFNMAVMGLRLAGHANGVAQLHGKVSRLMFSGLWPGVPLDDIPIGSITNGVHGATWVGGHIAPLFAATVGPDWGEADENAWQRVDKLDDRDVWAARAAGRNTLVDFVHERVETAAFDQNALTIGFARRFATYKRATLLLAQPERLRTLLTQPDRPVQFVFAGKAHPADQPGKDLIRDIEVFAKKFEVADRFAFIPDYDMAIARVLYHGCDVWLNNPRRPLEACGTSGMKAALNGALNCSVLDGWWDECYDGENGWVIASSEDELDLVKRDHQEADRLFELLERQIIPLFYDRTASGGQGGGGIPAGWITKVKHNWKTLGPCVTAARMVRDYTTKLYEPSAAAVQNDR